MASPTKPAEFGEFGEFGDFGVLGIENRLKTKNRKLKIEN
jgi:hypothetical protein